LPARTPRRKLAGVDWTWFLILGAGVATIVGLKRVGLVSPVKARACRDRGAKVIDVRSPAEFASGHLPDALNLPLDELRDQIGRHVPDQQQPVLLHCLSGMRSGMGKRILRQLGYANAFNLGSLRRAQRILGRTCP
jgi:rhodanese-related sulfurtransferase